MGKRRERRQQQASSRRVKLDLFMDDASPPSEIPGSLTDVDSTLGEEVEEEAANENPLSLLGQYSDDDADEDDELVDDEAMKDSSQYQDEQDLAQNQAADKSNLVEKEDTSTCPIGNNAQESRDFLISDMRVEEATVENEWQPVLDDRSGEYYYWNVRTGETTWVKPVESGVDKLENLAVVPVDFDTLLGTSPEQSGVEIDTENDERKSSDESRSPRCEGSSVQHAEKALTPLESTHSELNNANAGLVSGKNGPAGDASMAPEKREDLNDPESTAGSNSSFQGRVDHEGENLKKEEGEKDEENSLSRKKDDKKVFNLEAANDIQGTPEKSTQQSETGTNTKSPLTKTSLEGSYAGQITVGDVQDASGCMKNSLLTKESQRTIDEEMASLGEIGESLHHRLNVLAREPCSRISRCALMASQTEARLTDWKAFCALGFVPEACLSFMQKELEQIELVLAAEEASESERHKLVDPAATFEATPEKTTEVKSLDWSLNYAYYQQDNSAIPEPWTQGQSTEITGKGDDVEEGEIQTSYAGLYPAYGGVTEGMTAVDAQKVSNDTGIEDVDMDVDMEVDDEVEAEPAVPGVSSDFPPSNIPVPYLYPYPLPGSIDMSSLAPLDSTCVGEPAPYFHTGISGDSWAPPLPPDDEWAPPPPGESEPAPPPPPDEPPPLPPQSPEVIETLSVPSMPSEVQLAYFVPEYNVEINSLPQSVSVEEYQSIDSSVYGAYVGGVIYANCSQSTETLKIEHPYVVASASTPAFSGWTAPVLATSASSLVSAMSSEAPLKSSSYAASVPAAMSMTAETNEVGASLEVKKPVKGKIKKRPHAVAAAPMLNKKVSNLVNKWKQAKEELHGDEDAEEDKALYDVEVLEKKRQKEIEEWRRQQIASGDALDNANFQPLGTLDWRERVKRARKADSKEGKEGTTGSVASPTVKGQTVEALKSKKPNLTELCKGLPAGWQAYWDEASGEVYYGNLSTQETTWDRPVS